MDRRALNQLRAWKVAPARKPLVLRGARQVGKTWLLKEFARSDYENVAYVNCERYKSVASIFQGDLVPDRMLQGLSIAANTSIDAGTTLVIIDEIQEAPNALTALKYFAEECPEVHIAAAGSLLGIALGANASFPVGKVDFIDLHPLDFDEYLRAIGETRLADLVNQQNWTLISSYANRLIELLRQYMYVGGMPEVVARHVAGDSLNDVRAVQLNILRGYRNDFGKHASPAVSLENCRSLEFAARSTGARTQAFRSRTGARKCSCP